MADTKDYLSYAYILEHLATNNTTQPSKNHSRCQAGAGLRTKY